MTPNNELAPDVSESAHDTIRQVWESLSEEQRKEYQELLIQLPTSLRPLKDILFLVLDQYKPVLGNKHSVVVVGPANVGKSTLYNQLISDDKDRAEVGPVPGTTRQNQEADTGLFTVIDTPGADAVGEVGERERAIALQAAERADFLLIMFEATRGIKRYEKDLFDELLALDKPFAVVLNKMDLVPRRDRAQVRDEAARNLRLKPSQILDIVATEGTNVGRVVLAIARSEPELLAAIAEAMPMYRTKLAWQRIVPAAGAAAVVGLIPLPFVDLIPLLGIQAGLALSIARIFGCEITLRLAKELVATFGLGLMGRTAFQQLSKLGGIPGWLLSAAIAASTTMAIGYAALMWFSRGERPTPGMMQRIVTETTIYLKDQLADLGKKRPDRDTVHKRITQALNALPGQLPSEPATSSSAAAQNQDSQATAAGEEDRPEETSDAYSSAPST